MARHACMLVVRSTTGDPVPEVGFVVEQASEPMPEIGYVTGTDGTARVGLPPGKAALRFFLPDGRSQVVIIAVGNEAEAEFSVVLNTSGAAK